MAKHIESLPQVAETTGYHNNCGFNCISHFLIRKILTATEEELAKMFKEPGLQRILSAFSEFYKIPIVHLTPKVLQDLFKQYKNPIDRELILGPVLRQCFGELMIKRMQAVEQNATKQLDLMVKDNKELIDEKMLKEMSLNIKEEAFDNQILAKAMKIYKVLMASQLKKPSKPTPKKFEELKNKLETLMGDLTASIFQFGEHFDNKKRIENHEINPISTTTPDDLNLLTDTLGIRLSWQSPDMAKPGSNSVYAENGAVKVLAQKVPQYLGNLLVYNKSREHWEFKLTGDEKELKEHNQHYEKVGKDLAASERWGEELLKRKENRIINDAQYKKESLAIDNKVVALGKMNKVIFWNTFAESYGCIRDEKLREESRNLIKTTIKTDVMRLINAPKPISVPAAEKQKPSALPLTSKYQSVVAELKKELAEKSKAVAPKPPQKPTPGKK